MGNFHWHFMGNMQADTKSRNTTYFSVRVRLSPLNNGSLCYKGKYQTFVSGPGLVSA